MRHINFNSVERVLSFKKFEFNKELFLPEICFAGRSNVGKSSLVNSLLNRKDLARVSKQPGQTKKILFYRIDNFFSLVDVPGYGYAALSKKKIAEMSMLLNSYFSSTKNLKKVYILIDSRQGIKEIDINFLDFLNQNKLQYNYILTKSDKIRQDDKKKIIYKLTKEKRIPLFDIIFTSSKTKEGIKELKRNILNELLKNEKCTK
ncbi:MAG: ribosome biogenesis GTP-binding protein YihA/YsxC [Pseudomonadota bacterium]|nr:ribosome biogenesis GTP-binding protein YihA/YsxC [Pseudomonadota bacterium]